MIYNEKNDHFTIIDGKISGDQINIYYDRSFPSFSTGKGAGTLLGTVKGTQISGTWYANQRTQSGHSRKGPWTIRKTSSFSNE